MPTSSPTTLTAPQLITLENNNGMRLTISQRGATLVSWWAPDRYGRLIDVLLGYPDAASYDNNACYFGSIVGRWGNRIAKARFTLDGVEYILDANEGDNQLHGGSKGFHQALWQIDQHDKQQVVFSLTSPAGECGFPGKVQVKVHYRLTDDGSLSIDYEASTDAPTPLNLTSHPYFNLHGGDSCIRDHQVRIDADHYLAIDAELIPVDKVSVSGSAFDFRHAAPVGPRLHWPDQQVALVGGFDHCYCLRDNPQKALREVARVYDPASGRELTVSTTATGLQFYSGNGLTGIKGRAARPYMAYDGFCMEAQAWPNQMNGPDAEAVILRPGQTYRQTTVYRLGVQDIDALNVS
jgi:aldose 1-epimerase